MNLMKSLRYTMKIIKSNLTKTKTHLIEMGF
jgi:hypothetical protein